MSLRLAVEWGSRRFAGCPDGAALSGRWLGAAPQPRPHLLLLLPVPAAPAGAPGVTQDPAAGLGVPPLLRLHPGGRRDPPRKTPAVISPLWGEL